MSISLKRAAETLRKRGFAVPILGGNQTREQIPMERRAFLAAAAATPAGLLSARAGSYDGLPDDVAAALARFRNSIPSSFDRDYVEHAVIPFFLTSIYEGERPALPMIDVTLTKENALPYDLWGLIYKAWQPTPEEGVTVFLQGLGERGDNNLRKRIYFSAVTPDLYRPMYQAEVIAFFEVKGDAVPAEVRQIGESFNTVLAYRNPMQPIVYENYMQVRALLDPPMHRHAGDASVVNEYVASVRLYETGDHAQRRRLATAARPSNATMLPGAIDKDRRSTARVAP
jgi:hypothetical protein